MSSVNVNAELANNGWAAVPRSHTYALKDVNKNEQAKLDLNSVKVPDSEVARRVFDYAKASLPEKTFNHSMRVWSYGERHRHHPASSTKRIDGYQLEHGAALIMTR
jgi:cyanamide hydratase